MEIEVSFEVWQNLTARRGSKSDTYDSVLRRELGMSAKKESVAADNESEAGYTSPLGRFLPNGTKLRATYKGGSFYAEIEDGRIVGQKGEQYRTLSAAARSITKNNVNGLTFWRAQRPGEESWILVTSIPKR